MLQGPAEAVPRIACVLVRHKPVGDLDHASRPQARQDDNKRAEPPCMGVPLRVIGEAQQCSVLARTRILPRADAVGKAASRTCYEQPL